MTIDLAAALRRRKPERRRSALSPRSVAGLTTADVPVLAGRPILMLDTNVYIRAARGRLPPAARALVDNGLLYHCAVCLAELTTGLANADPARPGWADSRAYYAAMFASLAPSRILAPDAEVWSDAGLIAGTLARTQGYQPHQRKDCLNDALIFLTATKAGLPVLTENRDDFDLIQQLAPEGRFISF